MIRADIQTGYPFPCRNDGHADIILRRQHFCDRIADLDFDVLLREGVINRETGTCRQFFQQIQIGQDFFAAVLYLRLHIFQRRFRLDGNDALFRLVGQCNV